MKLRTIGLLGVGATLTGCGVNNYVPEIIPPYRYDIAQGNYITQEMVAQLKPGMTRDQVRFALGTPLIADTFHADRWDYVFRLQKGDGRIEFNRYVVNFKDNLLDTFGGSDLPTELSPDQQVARQSFDAPVKTAPTPAPEPMGTETAPVLAPEPVTAKPAPTVAPITPPAPPMVVAGTATAPEIETPAPAPQMTTPAMTITPTAVVQPPPEPAVSAKRDNVPVLTNLDANGKPQSGKKIQPYASSTEDVPVLTNLDANGQPMTSTVAPKSAADVAAERKAAELSRREAQQAAMEAQRQAKLLLDAERKAAEQSRREAQQAAMEEQRQAKLALEAERKAAEQSRREAQQAAMEEQRQAKLALEAERKAAEQSRREAQQVAMEEQRQAKLLLEAERKAAEQSRREAQQAAMEEQRQAKLALEAERKAAEQSRREAKQAAMEEQRQGKLALEAERKAAEKAKREALLSEAAEKRANRLAAASQSKPSSTVTTAAAAQATNSDADVLTAVQAWAQAWSSRDVAGYLDYYAPSFQSPGKSRAAWEAQRRQRLSAASNISVDVNNPTVEILSSNTAKVTFEQAYRSNTLSEVGNKQLDMVKTTKGWKINRESFVQTSSSKPAASVAAEPMASAAPAKTTSAVVPMSGNAKNDLLQVLDNWAQAWSNKDVDSYLGFYDSNYKSTLPSRAAWEAQRKQRLSAPEGIRIDLLNVDVQLLGDRTARISFEQRYRSNKLNESGAKVLDMVLTPVGWKISNETFTLKKN